MAEKSKSIFDHIKQITEIQNPNYIYELSEKELKDFNIFMIHRFLGYCNDLTFAMSYIDKYVFLNNMSKERFYKLLISIIPKGRYWINFPKKQKDNIPPSWFLDLLKEHYEFISTNDAIEYYYLLTQNERIAFSISYGIQRDKLKELN